MEDLSLSLLDDNTFDIIIVAGGSDYRAYESLRLLAKNKTVVKTILFFRCNERDDSSQNEELSNILIKLNSNVIYINCSIKDPNSSLNTLINNDSIFNKKSRIAIDISCFTKPYFFYLLKLISNRYGIRVYDIFYTEPLSYHFPEKSFTSYKSSKGPLTILEIPGYSGREKRNDLRLLIILLGFDGDLAKEICEDITPSKIILVNSFPGYIPKYKDMSLVANEKLTSNKHNKIMYSRADNPFELFNLLSKIECEHKGYFINIAPLGTKPMALGACLYALMNNSVRVIYPYPEDYLKVTTHQCWNTWLYNLEVE